MPDELPLLRVDTLSHEAWLGEQKLNLTTLQFGALALLAQNAGTVISREEFMREVWKVTWWKDTKTLDMHISWLRRKLGDDPQAPRFISTVRGVGFRIASDVVVRDTSPVASVGGPALLFVNSNGTITRLNTQAVLDLSAPERALCRGLIVYAGRQLDEAGPGLELADIAEG